MCCFWDMIILNVKQHENVCIKIWLFGQRLFMNPIAKILLHGFILRKERDSLKVITIGRKNLQIMKLCDKN